MSIVTISGQPGRPILVLLGVEQTSLRVMCLDPRLTVLVAQCNKPYVAYVCS